MRVRVRFGPCGIEGRALASSAVFFSASTFSLDESGFYVVPISVGFRIRVGVRVRRAGVIKLRYLLLTRQTLRGRAGVRRSLRVCLGLRLGLGLDTYDF